MDDIRDRPGTGAVIPIIDPVTEEQITAHPAVEKVAFTGSTEVGKEIVRASAGNLKKVMFELGGKSPMLIYDDADLNKAIFMAAMGTFIHSGRVCPVVSILPFDDDDEAVAMANDSTYGLAATAWTNNLSRAHRLGKRLQAGTVTINCQLGATPTSVRR